MEFFLVYIQEAHPSDSWQLEVNERENVVYEDPDHYDERVSIAQSCSVDLGIEFPALVDTIDNATEAAYTAWPDRLYVINKGRRIAYKSAAGPFGFKATELAKVLEQLVGPATVSASN